ncbi:MAG: hypothetical protein ACYCQJ_05250 [Nitrososphaerales archaeon]
MKSYKFNGAAVQLLELIKLKRSADYTRLARALLRQGSRQAIGASLYKLRKARLVRSIDIFAKGRFVTKYRITNRGLNLLSRRSDPLRAFWSTKDRGYVELAASETGLFEATLASLVKQGLLICRERKHRGERKKVKYYSLSSAGLDRASKAPLTSA